MKINYFVRNLKSLLTTITTVLLSSNVCYSHLKLITKLSLIFGSWLINNHHKNWINDDYIGQYRMSQSLGFGDQPTVSKYTSRHLINDNNDSYQSTL